MALVWKRLNSDSTYIATWTTEDEQNNTLPTVMPDGSPIPVNNFGINVATLNPYYWNGNEWIACE